MRAVLQRVLNASVSVGGKQCSKIGRGLLVLIGISKVDVGMDVEWLCRKILNVRLWENEEGKSWTYNVMQKKFQILVVSQFTLYAELKGNKPDFHSAMKSSESKKLYENVLQSLRNQYSNSPEIIQEGVFGNRMEVALVNDGPVTIQLDSRRDSPQEKSSSSSLLNKTETIATDNENLPIRDGIVEKQEKTAIQSAELTEANYK